MFIYPLIRDVFRNVMPCLCAYSDAWLPF